MSDRPEKQVSEKVDLSTYSSDVVVIVSLLKEISIGYENHSLPLCAYIIMWWVLQIWSHIVPPFHIFIRTIKITCVITNYGIEH